MEFTPLVFGNSYKASHYIVLPMEFLEANERKEENVLTALSIDEIVLYCLLLNRAQSSLRIKKFTKDGEAFVYFSQKEVCKRLKCGLSKAGKLLKELESVGLIEREKMGHGYNDRIFVKDWLCRSYTINKELKESLKDE